MPERDDAHLEVIRATMQKYAVNIDTLFETFRLELLLEKSKRHHPIDTSFSLEVCHRCNGTWTYPHMERGLLHARSAKALDEMHQDTARIHSFTNHSFQEKLESYNIWKKKHLYCEARNDELSSYRIGSDNRQFESTAVDIDVNFVTSSMQYRIATRNPFLLFEEILRPVIQQARESFTQTSQQCQHVIQRYLIQAEFLCGQIPSRVIEGTRTIGEIDQFRVFGMLLLKMGKQYATIGIYEQAIERFERSHRWMTRHLPDSKIDGLLTKLELALLYCHSGNNRIAVNLLEELAPIMEEILPRNDPSHSDIVEKYRRLRSDINHEKDKLSARFAIKTKYARVPRVDSTLIEHCTASITRDGSIQYLLRLLLSRSSMSRIMLQEIVRKLLYYLARDLHVESSDHKTRTLRQFIIQNSSRISNSILDTADDGTVPAGLSHMNLSSKQKWGIFDDVSDEDVQDVTEVSMSSEDLAQQRSDIMEWLSNRLAGSLAYQNFRLRIHNLAYPTVISRLSNLMERWSRRDDPNHKLMSRYRLKELVANLKDVKPGDLFLRETPSVFRSSLSFYQRKVERFTETPWDWWPLPPPLDPINEDECRLTWKCVCCLCYVLL